MRRRSGSGIRQRRRRERLGDPIASRPIPGDVERQDGEIGSDGRSDDRGEQRQQSARRVEPEPRARRARRRPRREKPDGPGRGRPRRGAPRPGRCRARSAGRREAGEQLVVERHGRASSSGRSGRAEEPAAEAEHDRVHGAQHARSSCVRSAARCARRPISSSERSARSARPSSRAEDDLRDGRLRDVGREVDRATGVEGVVDLPAAEEGVDQVRAARLRARRSRSRSCARARAARPGGRSAGAAGAPWSRPAPGSRSRGRRRSGASRRSDVRTRLYWLSPGLRGQASGQAGHRPRGTRCRGCRGSSRGRHRDREVGAGSRATSLRGRRPRDRPRRTTRGTRRRPSGT